jgi:teichuronic acid biosynthesis glycosyltransferase TuaC
MRVALITTSYPAFPGDPSGHFVQSEARLLARHADVTVLTTADGPSVSHAEPDPLTLFRLPSGTAFGWPGASSRVHANPLRLLSAASWTHRARSLLRSLPAFDRIIAHWALPSAFPVACGLGVPLEIVSHGADVRLLARLPSPLRRALMHRLLRDASQWRFVSLPLHDELARTLGREQRARLETIATVAAPPLDLPDVTAAITHRREPRGDGRLVVCVGRLVPGKRFDRALDHVARSARHGTRVVVVGDGPERTRLEQHARALGVDARFVGRATREDALAWIGAADGLLHASRAEGLSTVVREAEALGVPVEIID